MAFNQHHRTPARHHSVLGTGSSHSCLDGVPFKISPIFRPLPPPGLPSELLHGVPGPEVLLDEYDYDTEEGVLAWARAREEAKVKAIAERERAERARAALAAAESCSSSDSEDDSILGPCQPAGGGDRTRGVCQPAGGGDRTRGVCQPAGGGERTRGVAPPPLPGPRPPWQLPLAVSVGSAILTPMPIQTTKTKVQSPLAPRTQVDLALFEEEGDPFDNLELQTIDDMEELRALLEMVSAAGGADRDPASSPDGQPMYCNSEMVSSQRSEGGQAQVDGGGNAAASSRDKIYVNVTVRPATEVSGEEQAGDEGQADSRSGSALDGSGLSGSCLSGSGLSGSGLSGSGLSGSVCKADATSTPNCDFVMEPTGDGDYVMIRSDYSQKSLGSLHDSPSVYANVGSGVEGVEPAPEEESQELYSNSQVLTSTPPPVLPRVQSLLGDQAPVGGPRRTTSIVFNPAVRYSLPRTSAHVDGMADRMTQSAYVWSDSAPDAWGFGSSGVGGTRDSHTYSNIPSCGARSIMTASTPAFSNMFYSSDANNKSGSVNQVNRVVDDEQPLFPLPGTSDNHFYSNLQCSEVNSIMTVSMPAFSNHFYGDSAHQESESSVPGSIMSPTGGALRNARSDADLFAAGHGSHPPQPWNPYKPLPPTPVSDLRSSSSSTESLPTEPSQNPSPLVLSPSPSEFGAAAPRMVGEENDPFHRLSADGKAFVNRLTSMGFSRSRVSRAVEKFGNDEREVLDHMFNVDKLMEKKFTPALAEMSLQLFNNDMQKAEQFLDLFQQFKELGFTSERIQTALVKHELDRDKALDYLTT